MNAAAIEIKNVIAPLIHVRLRPPRQAAMKNFPHRWMTMKKKNSSTDHRWMLLKKCPTPV